MRQALRDPWGNFADLSPQRAIVGEDFPPYARPRTGTASCTNESQARSFFRIRSAARQHRADSLLPWRSKAGIAVFVLGFESLVPDVAAPKEVAERSKLPDRSQLPPLQERAYLSEGVFVEYR